MNLSLGTLQKIFFLKPDNYELETQNAFRKLIKPGMTVFDIGANSGYFTLLMADLVGKTGRVYSFEPYPPIFKLLKTNVETNNLDQVRLFPIALSDKRGEVPLSINPVNDGGHSLGTFKNNPDLIGWDTEKLKEIVHTETVDEFMVDQGIGSVDVIKIDVEGAETLVFAGAKNLLSNSQSPAIICEVGDIAQEQAGKSEKDLRKLLYGHDYRSYWIDNFREFDIETPVMGLVNVLFAKDRQKNISPVLKEFT